MTPEQYQELKTQLDALTTAVTRLTATMLPGEKLEIGTPLDQAQALIDSGMDVTEAYRQTGVIKSQRRRKSARRVNP